MSDEQGNTNEFVQTIEGEYREPQAPETPPKPSDEQQDLWLDGAMMEDLQSNWNSIQIEFVDEPRASVEQAKSLVTEATGRITRALTEKQTALDGWTNVEEVSTEDLRIALQRYRSFFNHLLTL
jgi:hypothetical protein